MKKRVISLILIFTYIFSVCSFALESVENTGSVSPIKDVYSVKYTVSDGLEYKRIISMHETSGTQREFLLEYAPNENTKMSFVGTDFIAGTDTIRNMAEKNLPDENFVAGINADFYNMSSGVPESAFIKDHEIYTSDRDSFCLAEREDGTYFIDKPLISMSLVSQKDFVYPILHFNKEFSEYGFYLYNDRYSTTTRINTSNTAVILYPFEDVKEADEFDELETNEELAKMIKSLSKVESYSDYAKELKEKIKVKLEEVTGYTLINGLYYKISDIRPEIDKEINLIVQDVYTDETKIEIPENAYALCGDNKSCGYILAEFKKGETFTLKIEGSDSFSDVKNAIGTGTVIVNNSEIIDDRSQSHYLSAQPRSAVGIKEDGTLVFYAVDGRQKGYSAGLTLKELAERMLSLGCVYAANLDGGGSTAVNVSLAGYDEADTVNSPSGKTERKIANAVVFTNTLEKDGVPYGANAYGDYYITMSDYMADVGKDIVLFDKNGFSADVESEDEVDDNTPEQAPEEDADAENEDTGAEDVKSFSLPEYLSLYTKDGVSAVENGVLYPNGYEGTVEVFASVDGENENVAATVISISEPEEIVLETDNDSIAPFESANISFSALYGGLEVLSDFDSFDWSLKVLEEDKENENKEDAETDSSDDSEDVSDNDSTAAEPEESENDDELANDTDGEEIISGVLENGVFTPLVEDASVEITGSKGEVSSSIVLKINGYPFVDMKDHWAVKEIYKLHSLGVVNGELDADGNAWYFPQREYSRFEFCAMVQRITGIGDDLEVPELTSDVREDDRNDGSGSEFAEIFPLTDEETVFGENSDETIEDEVMEDEASKKAMTLEEMGLSDASEIPEWAYEPVYRLFASGILDDMLIYDENGYSFINGKDYITRKDVMSVLGKLCEEAPDDYIPEYTDLDDELLNSSYMRNILYAGIFSGYEDGTLRIENLLTRAEAAAVFVRLHDHIQKFFN